MIKTLGELKQLLHLLFSNVKNGYNNNPRNNNRNNFYAYYSQALKMDTTTQTVKMETTTQTVTTIAETIFNLYP